MPKKNDPLTLEEMQEAADTFFPLFDVVWHKMKNRGGTTEDALKVMESVAKLGHKLRADKALEKKSQAFGFNKNDESKEDKD